MSFRFLLLIVFSFLCSVNSYTQNITTDRPDQTESSSTIPKSSFQIESGILLENSDDGTVKNNLLPTTLLRFSVSKIVELRFVASYQTHKNELIGGTIEYDGFRDLEVGAKIQLLKKEEVNTEIAFLSHLVIPSAKTALTTNHWGTINKLAVSHSITDRIGLGYNIGYAFVAKQSALLYSLALSYSFSEKVGFYIEPFGFWAEENDFSSNFDTGFTFLAKSNFQLDITYGFGINNDMEYFAAGFSWNIPHIFSKPQG